MASVPYSLTLWDISLICEVKQYVVMPRVFRHIQPSNSDSYAADKSQIPPKFTYNDISHNVRLYGTIFPHII